MSDVQELLRELANLDVAVTMVGDGDHQAELVPDDCELTLTINNRVIALTRHDGELIIQCLVDALHPQAFNAALEGLWMDMDEVVERIQRRVLRDKEPMRADVGKAQALCLAIARIINPYSPNVEAVRDEAMQRWEFLNDG